MAMPAEIESPCRNICRLSSDGTLCEGCGRTLGDIARWPAASEDERRAIAAAAARRLAARGDEP